MTRADLKRLAMQTLIVAAVVLAALVLWSLRSFLVTLALALVIAASLTPLIASESARPLPRWLSIGAVYLGAASLLGGAALLLGALLPGEMRQIAEGLQRTMGSLRAHWPAALPPLPSSADLYGYDLGQALLATSATVVRALFQLGLALVLSLCWSAGADAVERSALCMWPSSARGRLREGWRRVLDAAGSQIRTETAQSLIALLVLASAFTALGIPYPTVAALLVALLRVVPLFGVGFATAAAFVCGAANSLPQGVVAALATLIVVGLLARWVGRRAVARPSRLVSGLVLVALFEAMGLPGLILAPLVSALFTAVMAELPHWSIVHPPAVEPVEPVEPVEAPSLHEQLAELQRQLRTSEEPLRPAVANLVHRLDALIRDTASPD